MNLTTRLKGQKMKTGYRMPLSLDERLHALSQEVGLSKQHLIELAVAKLIEAEDPAREHPLTPAQDKG